jgi:hypothetical protein
MGAIDVNGVNDKKGELARGKTDLQETKLFDPNETVLLDREKYGLGEMRDEKNRKYRVFIYLPDEGFAERDRVLWQIPMEGEAMIGKPILGAQINFNFFEALKSVRSSESRAIIREFKKVEKKFGKKFLEIKWRLAGIWRPNILFIEPIENPAAIILGDSKK